MSVETRAIEVVRFDGCGVASRRDLAAAEEPLEIRLRGEAFVTIMRTPGADRELVAGFLLAERLVETADDFEFADTRRCTARDCRNVVDVLLKGSGAASPISGTRREVQSNSSCGVCGRRSIRDLLDGVRRIEAGWQVSGRTVVTLPERLRAAQEVFDRTGGLHAAGLFDRDGRLVCAAEDVGRHNAVDKVIGAQLLNRLLPLGDRLLCVSGRASFELVQKAIVAGIPLLAAVSAPSSLAVELARGAGLTLVGFVRGESFNVYSAPERVGAT